MGERDRVWDWPHQWERDRAEVRCVHPYWAVAYCGEPVPAAAPAGPESSVRLLAGRLPEAVGAYRSPAVMRLPAWAEEAA